MSKAGDLLIAWTERSENADALPEGERLGYVEAKDIAAGFSALTEEQGARFLDEFHERREFRARTDLVDAIATTKDTTALEAAVRRAWDERILGREGAGERFVHLALVRGRGPEAARFVRKLRSFTAPSGADAKMPALLADFPFDDELLDLAADALRTHALTTSNDTIIFGFSAVILASGQDRLLHAVATASYKFLPFFHLGSTRPADRHAETIEKYGTTPSTRLLAERLRSVFSTFPGNTDGTP